MNLPLILDVIPGTRAESGACRRPLTTPLRDLHNPGKRGILCAQSRRISRRVTQGETVHTMLSPVTKRQALYAYSCPDTDRGVTVARPPAAGKTPRV